MSAGLEVADVLRRHGDAYCRARGDHLGRVERRVMSAIELCRTSALGGHTEACTDCGLVRYAYNSCRNRHCPKCQGAARDEWLTLAADEFIRRFLLHTLPDGFHRIRHYGFLANGYRAAKLALCRRLLGEAPTGPAAEPLKSIAVPPRPCVHCGGLVVLLGVVPCSARRHAPLREDSS